MTAQQRLSDAQRAFNAAISELNAAKEQHEQEVQIPEMRKHVGKCFKYRNSYGGSDQWWTYVRVNSVTDDGRFHCVLAGRPPYPGIHIEYLDISQQADGALGQAYLPIRESEYRRAVRALVDEVASDMGLKD